jgi:hypothetical protein
MGFLAPKAPKVVSTPAANPAVQANANDPGVQSTTVNPSSLISTSSQGLTRKAKTQKPSLIGSSTSAN